MSDRVFIGWDSRFPEPGMILAHSLRENSQHPLDIRFLDYRHLQDCYGFTREPDPLATTEFSYSRFLVPWLCDFDGWALFLDNDMICLGDIHELFTAPWPWQVGKALYVVQQEHNVVDGSLKMSGVVQTAYPRKNWSSVMLMNCNMLNCWRKELVETAPGSRLHRFYDVPECDLGMLPVQWNTLDDCQPDTKLVHWTSGGPWNDATKEWPHQELWFKYRRSWLRSIGLPDNTPVRSQIPLQ